MLVSILVRIVFLPDSGAKAIVWIIFHWFQNRSVAGFAQHRRAFMLIGIETNINTIRKIVRIDSHALQIVGAIYSDSHLSIIGIAHVQFRNTTAKLDHTILLSASLLIVHNINALGVDASRLFQTLKCSATVFRIGRHDGLDVLHVLVNVFLCHTFRSKHLYSCHLACAHLLDLNVVHRVTFFFQKLNGSFQLCATDTHLILSACTNINVGTFVDSILQHIRCGPCDFTPLAQSRIQKTADR